jgi:hypothetical protein
MNIDLLKKLVRLANNNPNENEANSAARRVCKMIEEAKFDFRATISGASNPQPSQGVRTWNDVQRSTEPQWSSRPNPASDDAAQTIYDFINKMNEEKAKWQKENPQHDPFKAQWVNNYPNWGSKPGYKRPDFEGSYRKNEPKQEKPKRPIKCTECGNVKETAFVGRDDLYVCNSCQWGQYNEGRK